MKTKFRKRIGYSIRWLLFLYDLIIWISVSFLFILLHPSQEEVFSLAAAAIWTGYGAVCIFVPRFILKVYAQVWRYGGSTAYLRMIVADAAGGAVLILITKLTPINIRMVLALSVVCVDLLAAISIRMIYFVVYRKASAGDALGRFCSMLLRIVGRIHVKPEADNEAYTAGSRIPAAIVGAGRVGITLAQDLVSNPKSGYTPVCFVENDMMKVGRSVNSIPIIFEDEKMPARLKEKGVRAVILALPEASVEIKRHIYELFKDTDLRLMTYDFPLAQSTDGERQIRKFSIEEILARKPVEMDDKRVEAYYRGKTILITGGGGSIGSELCRQVLRLDPKQVIVADIAENTTYELYQELRLKYGRPMITPEICDVTNRDALEKVFAAYRPQIVLHAAAHKHVPLMEHNSVECVRNNVFGTLNAVELACEYGCEHFIMVSTDKAVNPTNVMGATKRMCELIVEDAARDGGHSTVFSSTRFGNVLGSAGSVVPLFRRQIEAGGPVTITHRDIIRFFMTIPEASQLVLTSGALARNGELFVLDMGQPVHIYDMAENMIRLSGLTPGVDIEIVETGLRPGEKLYEELLIDPDKQEKTENDLIFIERDEGVGHEELMAGLAALRSAVAAGDDEAIKDVLAQTVKTYHRQ